MSENRLTQPDPRASDALRNRRSDVRILSGALRHASVRAAPPGPSREATCPDCVPRAVGLSGMAGLHHRPMPPSDFRIELDGVEEVDSKRVLAFMRISSTGRASGIPMAMSLSNAYTLIDGKISHVRIFLDRHEALKAVGLEG
jgi:hypothetical protein